jgi:hypothetical protein
MHVSELRLKPVIDGTSTTGHALIVVSRRPFSAFRRSLSISALPLVLALLATPQCALAQSAGSMSPASNSHLNVTGKLPVGTVNENYNAVFSVAGGSSPYQFSVQGTLPPGVSLNPATGALAGKPTTPGAFTFEVLVTDSPRHDHGNQIFGIVVIGKGGSGGGGGDASVKIQVSPLSAALTSNEQQQFTATVSGTSNTAVIWSATGGFVDTNGSFTAPAVTAKTNFVVTATSIADSSKSANISVAVTPVSVQTLKVSPGNLSQGEEGSAYGAALSATGGTSPYSWSLASGALPPGIALDSQGDLGGLPTAAGTFDFSAAVSDSAGKSANGNFSVTVIAGTNFDGPAELPRVTVPSAMSDTPAPGSTVNVNAGGDLQAALNNANCGDTVELQAGATFTGHFALSAKNCDSSHWIIIRTSAPDSALPAEGQRATPCYAGVASLPGRPAYPCTSHANVMAKIQVQTQGDGPFMLANGAGFYRLIGLEITRPVGAQGPARLISPWHPNDAFVADHFVIDRSWLHGTTQDETHNGITLNGMTNVAIVDSYLSDFHCVSGTGACTDAHAISGGNSPTQDGPYKIQNNFLEASGESVLFGGGPAAHSPSDIQIIGNHFWKPWQWMPGDPNFVGGANGHPFVVKNHLELKNAVRVLIEANLMENTWGGFSQNGYAILLTPKNQATQQGKGPYVCPICQVTDVTIRYVHISHAGGGIQMATVRDIPGTGIGQPALAGARWSIHDVLIDDLSKKYVGGGTVFAIINSWVKNPLNTVTINHVTAFPDVTGHMMIMGNPQGSEPMYGLVFTNNLIITGRFPLWNADGGKGDCAQSDIPVTTIATCFTSATFSNNALIGSPAPFPPSKWPAHNLFPQTVEDVLFTTFNDANRRDYVLQGASPYKNKGTDGKDLGADIMGLNTALANVE